MPLFAKPLIGLVGLGAAPITLLLALKVKNDIAKPSIKWFYFLMLAGAVWSLTTGLETMLWNSTVSIFLDRFTIFTVSVTAILWFLFATEFSTNQTVSDNVFWVLLIIPLTTQIFVWTPQLHWLVYSEVAVTNGILSATFGPWGTLDVLVFGYGLTFLGFAALLIELLTTDDRTRKFQIGVITVGMSLPVAMTVGLNLGIMSVDISAYGFAVAGAIFLYEYREGSSSQLFGLNRFAWDQAIKDVNDPILNFDSEYILTDINPAAQRVFSLEVGWNKERITEQNPELGCLFEENCPDSIVTETNGDERWYSYQSSQVEYGRGAIGQTVILRDITAEKRQQERLQRQNERLDEFASVVSHDLRNPLTVVKGRLELVRDEVPPDQFETIQRNLQRMESIIEDVLTLAQAGETVETPDSVPLAEIAREARDHVDTDESTFEIEISNDLRVEADRDRLLHVFENLFRNAHEHNESPVTVRVGTFNLEDDFEGDRESIGLYIEDNGSGIPSDQREKIFERGYTTDEDGTGFGLSIVQDIVEAHGWDISLSDTTDAGVRFEITDIQPSTA
jgi:nitrogen-specific signal transduction histidine kinase